MIILSIYISIITVFANIADHTLTTPVYKEVPSLQPLQGLMLVRFCYYYFYYYYYSFFVLITFSINIIFINNIIGVGSLPYFSDEEEDSGDSSSADDDSKAGDSLDNDADVDVHDDRRNNNGEGGWCRCWMRLHE